MTRDSVRQLIVLATLAVVQQTFGEDASHCQSVKPEFSYLRGRPEVSLDPYNDTTSSLKISWSTGQILTHVQCADAFEVSW